MMPRHENRPVIRVQPYREIQATADASDLSEVLARARQAIPQNVREYPDGRVMLDNRRARLAGLNALLSLSTPMPRLMDADGLMRAPQGVLSGAAERVNLREAIAAHSQAVQAGAALIPLHPPVPYETGAVPVLQRAIDRFRVTTPAAFTVTADPETTPIVPAPLAWAEATLDRETDLMMAGAALTIPHSQWRDRGGDELGAELMWSIAAGLGRALDEVFVTALDVPSLSPFTVAAAAARGVQWADLRGLVGTGDVIDADPAAGLTMRGVPSELSAGAAAAQVNVIGAFGRAAIFTELEITVLAQRNAAGALIVTAWTGVQAAIPDPADFWAA